MQGKNHFACVSLNETDKLRLIGFPDHVQGAIESAIQTGWCSGLQRKQNYGDSIEYKLKGNFLLGQGSEAVPSRRFMLCVLKNLKSLGWKLIASTDISSKEMDKDVLFFRLEEPDPEAHLFCISLNESDKIRLIDSPPGLDTAMEAFLTQIWKKGIQSTSVKEPGCVQFKLRGTPWYADGEETVTSRILVLNILAELESNGWHLYGTIDMSTGVQAVNSKDTWFFRYDHSLVRSADAHQYQKK
jgi:hypothetical protein